MSTVQIKGKEGWSPVRLYESRGVDFCVTPELLGDGYRVTHITTGYAAAKRCSFREAQVRAVTYDRLFRNRKSTRGIMSDFNKLDSDVRVWVSDGLHRHLKKAVTGR